MKKFYIVVLVVCVVGLVLFCQPRILSDLPFVQRLVLHPDKWELKLDDAAQKSFRRDEQSGKAELLAFLQRYQNTYMADVGWLASAFCVAASFSVLGWMREKAQEKHRAEPGAPPDGGPGMRPSNSGVSGGPPLVS